MALKVFLALALAGSGAFAHELADSRELRLQIRGKSIEGLLVYRVPAGARAQMILASPAPAGTALVDAASLRLAPQALRGLRISGRAPRLLEARTRITPEGGLEAAMLLSAPASAELSLAVEGGAPLPALLEGERLTLLSGAGSAVPGGLALRPRAGLPCRVRLRP